MVGRVSEDLQSGLETKAAMDAGLQDLYVPDPCM